MTHKHFQVARWASGPLFVKVLIIVVVSARFGASAFGHDLGWMMEEAPIAAAVFAKSLEKSPPLTATVQIDVSGKGDPVPSRVSGKIACQSLGIRWDVKLRDVTSPQLTESAREALRQMNGEDFILLTRRDSQTNYVVLTRAQAVLEQTIPAFKLSSNKGTSSNETLDGRVCSKERRTAEIDGRSVGIVIWKAKDLKNAPIQLELNDSGDTIKIRLQDVVFRSVTADQLEVPGGLSRYDNLEDLVQSLVVDRVRKRFGF